ncbi:hypothetical protein DL769_009902 [Monosporascus sp. CRB-8-3]|nr:hypothetical protein DL769_009902 [Monosporascus sp. CRB-8-3]
MVKQRPLLACVKRVYGGAFSGYPESVHLRQAKVIDILVKEANAYGSIPNAELVKVKRKLLSDAAARITRALGECLGIEVENHLDRIARILVENQTIRGRNLFTNSCQWLIMRLLSGKDFEYISPRLSDNFGEDHDKKAEEASFGWPRYLVSFGPTIEGFNQSFYQPNSMITDFCQSRPTIDYDLIEYISLRFHVSPDTLPTSRVELSLSGDKVANNTTIPMDALWAMPGDTLSMLQFHLLRQPSKYQNSTTRGCLPEDDWNKNSFRVMQLLDTFALLAGALGASLFDLLSRDRQLLSQITIPSARVFGNIHASERVRIVRLSSRWVAYVITNRVPSAMGEARELRRQLQRAAGGPGDPVHGEEVLSTMVEFFLTPLALVGGRRAAENLGQIFRFNHNGPRITLNGFKHTLLKGGFIIKLTSESLTVTSTPTAAEYGHEEVVKLLLENGANPDSDSVMDETPLWKAAGSGYEAVVELPAEWDANPDSESRGTGRIPLSIAAENGHEAVVQLLLDMGEVDVDLNNMWGQTPLSYAAEQGHEAVVKLFLENGVDAGSKDKNG